MASGPKSGREIIEKLRKAITRAQKELLELTDYECEEGHSPPDWFSADQILRGMRGDTNSLDGIFEWAAGTRPRPMRPIRVIKPKKTKKAITPRPPS